jgi:hypothetical protein
MDLEQIAAKSLINCHCYGVDSIMLRDEPGCRLRMFVAHEGHELYKNIDFCGHQHGGLSVGLHPHHCDIRLTPVDGVIRNIEEAGPSAQWVRHVWLDAYSFESAITGGGEFIPMLIQRGFKLTIEPLDEMIVMGARELHTIYVEKGQSAAWLVEETTEDRAYQPVCYSNRNLEVFDFSALYEPMAVDHLETVMALYPAVAAVIEQGV